MRWIQPGVGIQLTPQQSTPATTPVTGSVTTPVAPGTTVGALGTTATTIPQKWTQIAGNLVGLTSDCGNVAIASRRGRT